MGTQTEGGHWLTLLAETHPKAAFCSEGTPQGQWNKEASHRLFPSHTPRANPGPGPEPSALSPLVSRRQPDPFQGTAEAARLFARLPWAATASGALSVRP